MYCISRLIRFGLSPENSSFIRSSPPETYCCCISFASCFCCLATVAVSCACSEESWVSLFSVTAFFCPSSASERSVVDMAFWDWVNASAGLAFCDFGFPDFLFQGIQSGVDFFLFGFGGLFLSGRVTCFFEVVFVLPRLDAAFFIDLFLLLG